LVLGGKLLETLDLLSGLGESQVSLGPDIGSAQGHQKIDVCCPSTDTHLEMMQILSHEQISDYIEQRGYFPDWAPSGSRILYFDGTDADRIVWADVETEPEIAIREARGGAV
jgi:hypothetical protein